MHLGAQLRTAFVLAGVLEANGGIEEGRQLRYDAMDQLRSIVHEDLQSVEIDETFFDQYVLFCHR